MAQHWTLHARDPQPRLLRLAAQMLAQGALIAMPTDACYVLACRLDDKQAAQRLREIRGIDERHLLTLMCADLSQLATYAQVDNQQYRFLKQWTPGAYTFVLPASREVPRRLSHPSRRTIGLRVPDCPVALGLLRLHGEPVLTSTLVMPGDSEPLHEADQIERRLGKRIELILDIGGQGFEPTSVIDLTGPAPQVLRRGKGDVQAMLPD
jgi:tRNA threonylcarbamoyl adenosine modification protein (Sua5/YciO/YrdC/YwlC family)